VRNLIQSTPTKDQNKSKKKTPPTKSKSKLRLKTENPARRKRLEKERKKQKQGDQSTTGKISPPQHSLTHLILMIKSENIISSPLLYAYLS